MRQSFKLEVPFEFQYTDCMKNKYNTLAEIEIFITKSDNGTLDNIWENICDTYGREEDDKEYERLCVEAFNKALNNLKELIS